MIIIDLESMSKEDFVDFLFCTEDARDFYFPREQELLCTDFDFEKMKQEFEEWMEEGSEV